MMFIKQISNMKWYFNIKLINKLATSNLECVFRCTSEIDEKLIESKYKETLNDINEKNFNIIGSADIKYYCSNIKPLYIVKL